jgi:hypothetical protein
MPGPSPLVVGRSPDAEPTTALSRVNPYERTGGEDSNRNQPDNGKRID